MSQNLKHAWKWWNGDQVDRMLRDSWLERVNCIKTIEVFSLCAGHPDSKIASLMYKVSGIPSELGIPPLSEICRIEVEKCILYEGRCIV